MPLRGRVLSAAAWSLGTASVNTALMLALPIVLGHAFTDSEIGLTGLAIVIFNLALIVAECGVDAAVVQAPALSQRAMRALARTSMLGGIAVALAMAVGADAAAAYYEQPALAPLLRCLAGGVALRSASVPQRAFLQRELRFRRMSLAETASVAFQTALACVLILRGEGPAGIAAAMTLRHGMECLLLWIRPAWRAA